MKTDACGHQVFKDDIVMECLGTIDELSALIMMSYHHSNIILIKEDLLHIARLLSKLCIALLKENESYINIDLVKELEEKIDGYQKLISPLQKFVIPGETLTGSYLHFTRTIARRLERRIVTYFKKTKYNLYIMQFVNRLSDLLFVMARYEEEKNV